MDVLIPDGVDVGAPVYGLSGGAIAFLGTITKVNEDGSFEACRYPDLGARFDWMQGAGAL